MAKKDSVTIKEASMQAHLCSLVPPLAEAAMLE